ncbi:hypothetical protein BKA66DRAFT_474978 [Pyrenochaeta sp. MPI-SDFR-AT-0127]|nr:hypothetical protein BKA66DRAFT_474978 [Pyrenochaeta sp. MPI-SDFR-AT-0127]
MTKKAAKRKDEDKTSARFLCNFLPRYIGQKMEREESGIEMVRNAQYATQATTHHQTLSSTPHVRTGIHLPTNGDLVPEPQSIRSHICHPLLPSNVSPITHMFFLTLYDTLIILILTLHIVAFASNIAPSLAFCSTPAAINYPPWAFHDSSGTDWTDGSYAKDSMGMDRGGRKVQLGMRERCQRINWGISTAGGWGCGGAAMLAALHVAGLGMRMWEVWGPEGSRDVEKRKHGMEEEGLDRSMETRLKEEEWENAPKDINIQTHATRPHVLSSSVSTPSAHPTTISEEEHNIGVRERDKRSAGQERRTEYKSESKSSEDLPTSSIRQAKWMETLLECLVP